MNFDITSNMLRSTVSVLDTGNGPKRVHTSFLPVKWPEHIRPIHNISLKSSLNTTVNVVGNITLFVRLVNIPVRVKFGVVDNHTVQLLITMSSIYRFVEEILSME